MPNYIGSVRTMVVAGQDGAYGNAEKTTPVKKPLMALATLPRVLGPSEKVSLPVTIFAMDDAVKNVNVAVKTNKMLKVIGESSKALNFKTQGDQVVNFDLDVAETIGKATVQIIATSGKEKSTYEIELDVRNPNLPVTKIQEAVLESGNNWSHEMPLHGMNGTNSLSLEVSTIPPINLEKRLNYLIRYPHGCIEQTTSSVFPQLYLSDIMEVESELKVRIQNNITAAINKIQKHQLSDGGFAYWIGSNSSSDWGSSYAGHFILEAEKKGYALPYGMKKQWINYQRDQAQKWNNTNSYYYNSDLSQAYRLYTLCLAGSPELSVMNRLRESNDLSVQAAWRLAAAYQIIGKNEVAKKLVANRAMKVKPYRELSYTYGSGTRDQAMIIETLVLMGQKTKAASLVKDLSEELSSNQWMSTQTTAYALKAISDFTKGSKGKGGLNYTYTYNGSKTVKSDHAINISTLDVKETQKSASISVKNNGNDIIFVRVVADGIPLAGDEESYSDNLNVSVVYKNTSGDVISVDRLEQGMDFVAEVTVSNPGMKGNYHEMALSQLFPSGWEIHNRRMDIGGGNQSYDAFQYQDIRDDRVYTYFDLQRNASKTFKINLHAAYLGEFYLPAVRCGAMYDNSISALRKGKRIQVVKPGS